MQGWFRRGNPPLTSPFASLIRHSAMHELRVRRPAKSSRPPGSGTSLHVASHPLPGCPFSGPASHSSLHSTRPLPQPSSRQLALQPSHDVVLLSSHSSPGSSVPFPQAAVSPGQAGGVGAPVFVGVGFTRPAVLSGISRSPYTN